MAGAQDDHLTDGEGLPSGFDSLASRLSGLGNRAPAPAFDWPDAAAGAGAAEHSLPGFDAETRRPWLYSAEDEMDEGGVDPRRVWGVVLAGLALLVLIAGGVWWTVHHRDGAAQMADGSLITAPPGPIKEAPQDPGGKTFDGTGDSSFAVSQGHLPGATLASGGDGAEAAAGAGAAPAAASIADTAGGDGAVAADSPAGAIGVQVGAFATQPAAEAAWAHLAKAYDALSGVSHRTVQSKADIGTVYGLQAVAGSHAAANALCDRLKAAGLSCQVKG